MAQTPLDNSEAGAPAGPVGDSSFSVPAALRHNAFIGRQAIYDRKLEVVGYELLFRGDRALQASASTDDEATAEVIINTFLEIGLDALAGEKPVFVNATRNLLVNGHLLALPPKRVVLEVLEDAVVDDELLRVLRGYADRGYRIALDDVTHPDQVQQLVSLASLVKVDVLEADRALLCDLAALAQRYKLMLLAEKVETHQMLDQCHSLGFELFQGFFLCKPARIGMHRGPVNRLAVVRLLAEIHRPDVQLGEIESLLKQDPSLSYKLLQLSNSALMAGRPVDSLWQALQRIGIERVANWATILILSQLGDKPHELINLALVRGFMCEELAQKSFRPQKESYFLAGILSVMDALLDRPMEEILRALPLEKRIKAALSSRQGPLGSALQCAIAYERSDWPNSRCLNLAHWEIGDAYFQALRRVRSIRETLLDSASPSTGE